MQIDFDQRIQLEDCPQLVEEVDELVGDCVLLRSTPTHQGSSYQIRLFKQNQYKQKGLPLASQQCTRNILPSSDVALANHDWQISGRHTKVNHILPNWTKCSQEW